MANCYHCGDSCEKTAITKEDKTFCCSGCVTVYEILTQNNLSYYYDLENNPGNTSNFQEGKYNFLDHSDIVEKIVDFNEGKSQIVTFLIPSIHCSSCIWVLENLQKINSAIVSTVVDFPKKKVSITYQKEKVTLKEIVILLDKLGYPPHLSLDSTVKKNEKANHKLIYQIGVAGFAFGNIMFLSFPEYFQIEEFWLERFKGLFRWLMFAFSIPVVFYAAQDYFIAAIKGIKSKMLNIDFPIALGVVVLFVRSTLEIIFDWGTGFFDSLTGLIFFLLLGKYFQQKTYAYLSFERDYKSYFPVAVTKINKEFKEEQIPIYQINPGDRLLIRNKELLPVDALLLKGDALIDYSFVTGEAIPLHKNKGEKLFAGGRQEGDVIEVEATKKVAQSYLTQLWGNEVFSKDKAHLFQSLTNKVSKHFTITLITIAFLATVFWYFIDVSKIFQVVTAVLIVACPCAIALAAPFTLGNILRYFGLQKMYLKEAYIIEQIAKVDTVVFDKTGTITSHKNNSIIYEGIPLTNEEFSLLTSSLRASNHPLSRSLYDLLRENDILTLDEFNELPGKGIHASHNNKEIKIGSSQFVKGSTQVEDYKQTAVFVSSNNDYKGKFIFKNNYREGLQNVFKTLSITKNIIVLSGDNDGEKNNLLKLLPNNTVMLFNQKPEDKLQYIKKLQDQGKIVMMVGDGLNDAGALAQSNVGVVVAENVNVFTPACDAILEASQFYKLQQYFKLSFKAISIIKWSFILSLFYNIIGLGFALTGNLKPVVAAILMPLSSISIVVFTSLASYYFAKKIFK